MKYLLLNGSVTSNLNTYLRDVLFLNFKALPSEIPFNTELGLQRYVLEESTVDYVDKIRSSVDDLIQRLNDRHGSILSLTNLHLDREKVIIEISMDDNEIESYSVPTLNTE
jgi:hypothetical protein